MLNKESLMILKSIPNSLYEELKIQFLFHSNKIEGSTFTEKQLHWLLDKHIVDGSHDVNDVLETINSVELFEEVVSTLGEEITEELIIRIHAILKKGTKDEDAGLAGTWKKYSNRISGTSVKLSSPQEVLEHIRNLIYWWNVSDKNFKSIVEFHVKFEQVHPFQDGNGRVGRFLMLKQCFENNVNPIVLDSELAKEYREALGKAQLEKDTVPLEAILNMCSQRFMSRPIVTDTLNELRSMRPSLFPN